MNTNRSTSMTPARRGPAPTPVLILLLSLPWVLTGCIDWHVDEVEVKPDPWEAYDTTQVWDGREPMDRGYENVSERQER